MLIKYKINKMLCIECKKEKEIYFSTPEKDAKNSNIDPNIEIVNAKVGTSNKSFLYIRLIKENYPKTDTSILTDEDLYEEEVDGKGVPFLKRIPLYRDLPMDVFVPVNCKNVDSKQYFINGYGYVYNKKSTRIYTGTINSTEYLGINLYDMTGNRKNHQLYRVMAQSMLFNPDTEVYCYVNHIDSNKENNKINNLEWITVSGNSHPTKINRKKFSGFKWNVEETEKKLNYSGNINDYTWYQHPIYPEISVCKEGFIKKGNRRIGTISRDHYVHIKVSYNGEKHDRVVQRIIIEFVENRRLDDSEIIDHIDTNKLNNSINNLRITTPKGNMNNPNTVNKYYKKLVLTDLSGDFIMYDNIKNVLSIIYKKLNNKLFKPDSERKGTRDVCDLIKIGKINESFFCILPEDKNSLYKKMESVVYKISNDKKTVLGAYDSMNGVEKLTDISAYIVRKIINTDKTDKYGNYYMRGEEAVKLVLALGHGTVANFKPEETK